MRLSYTVTEIFDPKDIGVTTLTFLRSRDVIGHVTIGLGVGTFLLVVNDDHASILHRYGDTGLQRFWGHEFDLLGSRDHSTRHMWFPIGGPLEPCVYLAPFRRYKASKLHLPMLKAKSSVRMRCRQGVQNNHIFGIPKSTLPIHYTTSMRLG